MPYHWFCKRRQTCVEASRMELSFVPCEPGCRRWWLSPTPENLASVSRRLLLNRDCGTPHHLIRVPKSGSIEMTSVTTNRLSTIVQYQGMHWRTRCIPVLHFTCAGKAQAAGICACSDTFLEQKNLPIFLPNHYQVHYFGYMYGTSCQSFSIHTNKNHQQVNPLVQQPRFSNWFATRTNLKYREELSRGVVSRDSGCRGSGFPGHKLGQLTSWIGELGNDDVLDISQEWCRHITDVTSTITRASHVKWPQYIWYTYAPRTRVLLILLNAIVYTTRHSLITCECNESTVSLYAYQQVLIKSVLDSHHTINHLSVISMMEDMQFYPEVRWWQQPSRMIIQPIGEVTNTSRGAILASR
jgi:hypothetical protein